MNSNTKTENFSLYKSQFRRKFHKCQSSRNYNDFPIDDIVDIDPEIFAYDSGPDTGVFDLDAPKPNAETTRECFESLNETISIPFKKHHRAYGISTSLYETNPNTKQSVGEPIADTYAIIARQNNSILLMADGVNWGVRSRRASRCAVRAALNHINHNLLTARPRDTHDIFRIMSKAFDEAQAFIVKKEATMTTLCCSVVVRLKEAHGIATPGAHGGAVSAVNTSATYAVCTLSVGDSTAYVYDREKGVFEVTKGARNLLSERDMRNVGGALGAVYGSRPDLSNLNFSVMYVKPTNIVFLVSDGISDNFDPCVSGVARKKGLRTDANNNSLKKSKEDLAIDDLPEMEPYERYLCSLKHLNEVLNRNVTLNDTISAQESCAMLIEHVVKLSEKKRQLLEKGFTEAAAIKTDDERLKYQIKLREEVQKLHGKLDHASIVAFEV